ncbi:hypothetical protein MHM98_18390 [Psychrobium sp. MM17-31]|uniref:hypothetical protein n=1 Tax=Psychrobium sp. MM17-31 TaxID=2917758 RepID=UPI001EF63F96|nr:hypothetical protein [Psychrobium sp. MM17-31]MCG7533300.1 hypothetical protein [Psychrobium sp. MM17-31]
MKRISTLAALLSGLLSVSCIAETQVSVKAAADYRVYTQDALYPQQVDKQLSMFIEPEIYHSWNDDLDSITFKPFYRWDNEDDERSHGDIRELMWLHVGDDWELRTGIGSVFWGQTESAHLVDIINQTDAVEAVDGEDKLGQPMINLTLVREWGNLDLFVLPGFRERTFAGEKGRLRTPLVIDTDNAMYQSSDEEHHIDFAARWSHSIDIWELGVSYFDGTSREPELSVRRDHLGNIASYNVYYRQISQLGIDVLAVVDSWLIKFEGIARHFDSGSAYYANNYFAMVTGFEYTTVGVWDSVWDIGWLMEYQFDDRKNHFVALGQNDLMLGSRLVLNDVNGTEVLFGLVQDLDHSNTRSGFVEASSRINDNWKWRVDARIFSTNEPSNLLYGLRNDDNIEVSLEYYF